MKARTKPIVAQSSETLEATTATDSAGKKSRRTKKKSAVAPVAQEKEQESETTAVVADNSATAEVEDTPMEHITKDSQAASIATHTDHTEVGEIANSDKSTQKNAAKCEPEPDFLKYLLLPRRNCHLLIKLYPRWNPLLASRNQRVQRCLKQLCAHVSVHIGTI